MPTKRRETLADTFAMITFFMVAGMAIEIGLSGLSFEQSLQSRLLSIPVNAAIARPYGVFRDWLLRVGRVEEGGFFRRLFLDIVAFVLFQIPVYILLVASTGASVSQIVTACIGQIGGLVFLARPYGVYMQYCRKIAMRCFGGTLAPVTIQERSA
ncbi:L-alanine exporter AlaE [Elysia marginata]|uniref:L-alanine exporter AlaE n=1 Tax=Elysia marginata TaxID=1093978 RepID=A0AAV4JV71_9GAST|nr:L-alanine exporter AlaE [Elysia marginata]